MFRFNVLTGLFDLVDTDIHLGGDVIGGTPGSVLFIGVDGTLSQDNANLFWDDTSNFLKVNEVRLDDNKKITFGDSNSADSFIEFDGTNASLFSTATHVFSSDGTATIQSVDGFGSGDDEIGSDFIVRAGDASEDSGKAGGDLTIRPGDADGEVAAFGTLYLGNATGETEVWHRLVTGAFFGDVNNNSAKIWHDGANFILDPRNTGTGGTLLFAANASFEGNVNFDQVDEITLAEAGGIGLNNFAASSGLAAGTYHYDFYYITANGETSSIYTQHGDAQVPDITIDADDEITIEEIPVSSDRRVVARGIMRTEANEAGFIAQTTHVINDNVTIAYNDTGDAPGTGALNFKKPNTTAGSITIETIDYLRMNEFQTYLGKEAGLSSIAPDNVAIGTSAFKSATTAINTVCIGVNAGDDIISAEANTFAGINAGSNITTGNDNAMFGAFTQPTGADVVGLAGFGKDALRDGPGTGQNYSAGFGFEAGKNFGGTGNTFLGAFTGSIVARIAASDFNVIIGYLSGTTFGTGADSNIIIGHNVEPDDTTGSNQLKIGRIIKGDSTVSSEKVIFPLGEVGIGALTTPAGKLHVRTADNGFTFAAAADDLILEGTGNTGMTISAGAGSTANIYFGDSNNDVGRIYYDHSTNTMHFWDLNVERMILANAGSTLITPSLTLGSNFNSGTITDQVRKLGRMFLPPFDNADRPINVFLADSDGSINLIGFGDGSANGNKASEIRFTTGPNDTTQGSGAVDTSVLKVNSSQETLIGAPGVGTDYTKFSATGDITQVGTGRTIESEKFKLTGIGGYAIKLTNTTGANTVQGQLVKADPATNDAVILTAADDEECFGVFLDSGVADDAEAWVVVAGIADVAMGDNEATTAGNWVETNSAEAGYADATAGTPAAAPQHFNEIGHCIETVAAGGGGTHILARCVLHFN